MRWDYCLGVVLRMCRHMLDERGVEPVLETISTERVSTREPGESGAPCVSPEATVGRSDGTYVYGCHIFIVQISQVTCSSTVDRNWGRP